MRLITAFFILISFLLCSPVWADEIVFTNGDKLTGQLTSYADGKIRFKSSLAGTVTINIENIISLESESPVTIVFTDGSTSYQPLYIALMPPPEVTDFLMFESVELMMESITHINPPEPSPPPKPKPKWTGNITGGSNIASGNTESEAINLGYDLTYRHNQDRFRTRGAYNYGRQKDSGTGEMTTNRDNWFVDAKYDHFYDTKCFWYWSSRLEKDKIRNLDQRWILGSGFGHQFIDRPKTKFSLEGGAAWKQEIFYDDDSSHDWNIKLGYSYTRDLNSIMSLTHNSEYLPKFDDFSDYLLSSDLGLRTYLMKNMFANFTIKMTYDSDPSENIDNTDIHYSLGLGFKIN